MKVFDVSSILAGPIDLPDFGKIQLVTSDNTQRDGEFLPIKGVVMHWTAGDRMTVYAAYHWCIADNGTEAAIIRTLKPAEKGEHAWHRNTGLVGASYAATADSAQPGYGPGAPTARQREAMQILVGELCAWHKLDPHGESAPSVPVICSHQTLAILDGYADERWDTGNLLAPDRLAAQAVYDDLKAGTRRFTLAAYL